MAPKAEKKPAKKVVKASGGKGKKGKKSVETYKIYIYKVLKQVRLGLRGACRNQRHLRRDLLVNITLTVLATVRL